MTDKCKASCGLVEAVMAFLYSFLWRKEPREGSRTSLPPEVLAEAAAKRSEEELALKREAQLAAKAEAARKREEVPSRRERQIAHCQRS